MPAAPAKPLRVLALDGGGVKGLTSLLILDRIFRTIKTEFELEQQPLPCDCFDIICGTSTGGLIALMLGRLQMSIADCMKEFEKTSARVFKKGWFDLTPERQGVLFATGKPWFNSDDLKASIQDLLEAQGKDKDMKLMESGHPNCRVFVCATRQRNGDCELIRSYATGNPMHPSDTEDCYIWEAALATAAAPGFFKAIEFEASGARFVDGAMRDNNPIFKAMGEANDINNDPDAIACVLSIGTGKPHIIRTDDNLKSILKTCVKLATDSDAKAQEFAGTGDGRKLLHTNKIFRFDVEQGMGDVELYEFDRLEDMRAAANHYLNHQERANAIRQCARKLYSTTAATATVGNFIPTLSVQAGSLGRILPRIEGPEQHNAPQNKVTSSVEAAQFTSGQGELAKRLTEEEQRKVDAFLDSIFESNGYHGGTDPLDEQPGTCEWISKSTLFQSWRDKPSDAILFILGDLGCGKSTLAKYVSKQLGKIPGAIVLRFFCKGAGPANKDPLIIQYFLRQILSAKPKLAGHVLLRLTLPLGPERVFSSENASVDILWEIFEAIIQDPLTGQAFFLVDGLDECRSEFIQDFLARLERVFPEHTQANTASFSTARVLLTSIPVLEIERVAIGHVTIKVDRTDVNHDIEKYATVRFGKIADFLGLPQEEKESSLKLLCEKADGMFLWAFYVVEQLRSLSVASKDIVRNIILSSPRQLDMYYKQALQDIPHNPGGGTDKIFMILLFACTPLSTAALAEVLQIKEGRSSKAAMGPFIVYNIIPQINSRYAHLVKVTDDIVEPVHNSLREFILSIHENPQLAKSIPQFDYDPEISHLSMAELCIRYLLLEDFEAQPRSLDKASTQFRQTYPFHRYAFAFWHTHIRASKNLVELAFPLLSRFLDINSPNYRTWNYFDRWLSGERHITRPTPLLHTVSRFGLVNLLGHVHRIQVPTQSSNLISTVIREISNGVLRRVGKGSPISPYASIAEKDPIGYAPLHYAAISGRVGAVDYLLRAGADVNALTNLERLTPLHFSCMGDNLDMLTRLLHAGAAKNVLSSTGYTPLLAALYYGYEHIAHYLILDGADCTIRTGTGKSALHLAAERGFSRTASILITRVQSILSVEDDDGYTPLHYAASGGEAGIVKQLLEHGVDKDLRVGRELEAPGPTPLILAGMSGHTSTVEALLEYKADVTIAFGSGSTALHEAARGGYSEIVSRLIDAGSDINAVLDTGPTALFLACENDHLKVVQHLLSKEAKADLMLKDSNIGPLAMAAWLGYEDIIQVLLGRDDCDREAETNSKRTPLHTAAINGQKQVVKKLINARANVNNVSADGFSILHDAVRGGQEEIALLLLENGANADTRASNECGRQTPLHDSVRNGFSKLVSAIVESGVDINVEASLGWSPLLIACFEGNKEMADLLLGLHANPRAQTHYGLTTLHASAQGGNAALAKQILGLCGNSRVALGTKTIDGSTPLHSACWFKQRTEVTQLLLDQGADIHAKTINGRTALHISSENGDTDLVELLLGRGATVNETDYSSWTPLHCACDNGHLEAAHILLANGADINAKTEMRGTPLHLAAQLGDGPCAQMLVDGMADINAAGPNGCTPLHLAISHSHRDVSRTLLVHGANPAILDNSGCSAFDCLESVCFSEATWLCTSANHQKWIENVVQLSRELRFSTDPNHGELIGLAKTLLLLGRDEDAMFIYSRLRDIGKEEDEVRHLASCDHCDPRTSIFGDRYTCRSCPDFDLCSSCMEKYNAGLGRKVYNNHRFFKVGQSDVALEYWDPEDPHEIAWLEQTENKYADMLEKIKQDSPAAPPETPQALSRVCITCLANMLRWPLLGNPRNYIAGYGHFGRLLGGY